MRCSGEDSTFQEQGSKFTEFYNMTEKHCHEHGRLQGGINGRYPPLEIGTKNQKFLENLKSAT